MASEKEKYLDAEKKLLAMYGENALDLKKMKGFLPEKAYKQLKSITDEGSPLPEDLQDYVAEAMKKWAISKGATHYTHWFQPLTGLTAEKHDSFFNIKKDTGVRLKFTGKNLVIGESDASSFPSGGLRATFEAKGYTTWDPTSPAFIKYMEEGPTLCIPTAFCSYTGEALDKKTPLLRSIEALSKSVKRMIKLFDGKVPNRRAITELGPEQEYFLIDKEFYLARPDLILTGRTLFGKTPAKHQQMEDHYFGSVKKRIIAFMEDVDRECWKMGIPATTRHNEVAPAQFELATQYEDLNIAADHNMMVMEVLKDTAEKHGLVCLLHEKPFAGVNGSGKHNNWSICGPDGKNLMDPGKSPHENAKFLTVLCAVIKAVDKHARLLRATVASAGNDHRLGANEAPPAIMSIFLGDQLTDIIEQIEKGGAKSSKAKGIMKLGVTSLPNLFKDVTDRNRTSPFAFTGTKFEFRAVGSSMSCSGPNIILNTITAEALDEISDNLEKAKNRDEFNKILQKSLCDIIKEHKRVIFNGDNYSKEWEMEAKRRGLPNIKNSEEALKAVVSKQSIELFEKYAVLSGRELNSRYNTYHESYEKAIDIEGKCALDMAKTMFLPVALKQQKKLCKAIKSMKDASGPKTTINAMRKDLAKTSKLVSELYARTDTLEKAMKKDSKDILKAMIEVRAVVDELEATVEDRFWPVPKYRDMLFIY